MIIDTYRTVEDWISDFDGKHLGTKLCVYTDTNPRVYVAMFILDQKIQYVTEYNYNYKGLVDTYKVVFTDGSDVLVDRVDWDIWAKYRKSNFE